MKYIEHKAVNLRNIELIVFTMIWVGIFSIPFFQNRQLNLIDWEKVTTEWMRMSAFLAIFVLNINLLVPKLLFKKKYTAYLLFSLLSTIILISIIISLQILINPPQPLAMPPMDLGPGMPPMELGAKMPAPMGYRAPTPVVQQSIYMDISDNLIIAILVIAAGTAFKMLTQWLNEEGRRKDVEKEQLKTEISLLRHQVSPHFLMNTLNNIHALIDINTETAKDAIIRLSTLMRYLLYDTAMGQTSLKKEIEFIESYITLMKLRFSNKVVIKVEVPQQMPDIQLPPMLLISFIENAFKHGVSYQHDSFVYFKLEVFENKVYCCIKNSKHKRKENPDKSYSGIGLANIKKSLALLFENEYVLDIKDNTNEFEVELTIPIYDNKMHSN